VFETAAIVLAAGLSRRMGAINKLLIEIDGVPMIRRPVQICLEVCDGPVTIVTGHQREAVEQALAGLEISFVFNPDFEAGQKTSVAAGLVASTDAKDTLIALGDQPFLRVEHISWLLTQHRQNENPLITVPIKEGQRGNPLVVPHSLKPMLLADRRSPGCQKFTRENPALVCFAATQISAFFSDIDTPEELETLQIDRETVL